LLKEYYLFFVNANCFYLSSMIKRTLFNTLKDNLPDKRFAILTGSRQVGKTTLAKQLCDKLKLEGQEAHFFTMEDPALRQAFNEHPENIFTYFSPSKTGRTYIFIDEVQYLQDPSNFLKLLYDQHWEKIKIIATGSSAFYIDKKFKDSLAGRKQYFELYPLDFEEFLIFKERTELIGEWTAMRKDDNRQSVKSRELSALFEEYLIFGGYPAVVLGNTREEKIAYLNELKNTYLKKDVTEAGIGDEYKFHNFLTVLADQEGSLVNLNSIGKTLKISNTALENYLYVLRKSYHVQPIRPFYKNVRKELTKMPKIYFTDMGFRNVMLNNFEPVANRFDKGAFVENGTFIRLRELYGTENIRFWRTADGNEVDFVINIDSLSGLSYEVKYSDSEFRPGKYKKFTANYPAYPMKLISYLEGENSLPLIRL